MAACLTVLKIGTTHTEKTQKKKNQTGLNRFMKALTREETVVHSSIQDFLEIKVWQKNIQNLVYNMLPPS